MYTYIEVEPNDNCPMAANLAFKNLDEPFLVASVRIFDGQPDGTLYAITGWSSANDGSPVEAHAVQVEDSGAGNGYLVYGGDWGVRLRALDAGGEWDTAEPEQWGETHLLLADLADIIPADA
jgi:hypothetical protein